jgi:energy-coupling factor transporter ATP-binding protein EcfA2
MKLSINNFGPVKGKQNYSIDLSKSFTLVTGANGLGKTYLGYIIYAIVKRINNPIYLEITDRMLSALELDNFENGIDITIEFTEEKLNNFVNVLLDGYKENIHTYMGIDRKSANMLFKDLEINFLNVKSKFDRFFESEITKNVKFGDNKVLLYSEKDSAKIEISSDNKKITDDFSVKTMLNILLSVFICEKILANEFIKRVFYLPVERNSLYTFSKELSLKRSQLIDQMQSLLHEKDNESGVPDFLRKNANRYPEAIEDALKQAQDLTQLTKNEADPKYIDLAKEIEAEILNGEVIINSEGEVEFSPGTNNRKHVPVHLSASFIKTVSSIIFYLKHIAVEGDMIMIDEPEMNLHPTLQITFARILAKISNTGIKIWMSTHSDYIISELNNLCLVGVLRNKGQNDFIENLGYASSYFLDKEKMQALYLNGTKTKTQVKIENLNIRDDGIDIESIDNCLSELNARSNELFEFYENLD